MKTLEQVRWGWEKDPPDERDFQATRLIYAAMPLPATFLVNPNTPIYNQGDLPACVGYSCAGVKSDEEFLQHKESYLFDGAWLYEECKKIDGMPDVDGTYLRHAMHILRQQGMKQVAPPCRPKKSNSFWEIKAYFRLDNGSPDDLIKQVIFQYGTIAVGSSWYRSWMSVGESFPEPDTVTGGHAYRICGWSDVSPAGWIVANSWGKLLWGRAGIAMMPYSMFRSTVLDAGGDIWKLIDK